MSNSIILQRLTKQHSLTFLIGFLILSFVFLARHSHEQVFDYVRGSAHQPAFDRVDATALEKVIEALYKPRVHSITAESFTDDTGEVFHLTGKPFYEQKLGSRVLILDADTRPMTDDGQLFSKGGVKWPNTDAMSAGILSHYLYAKIHGYDYQFVQNKQFSNWSQTWVKVPEIKDALMTHDYVVFLDQDAMFRYPALPLEWLMNHWQHNDQTSLMLAAEPDKEYNTDGNGTLYFNTGFIIAQNSTRTHDIIDAWLDCPKGIKYDACRRFAWDWPHEQAALVGFVKQHEFTNPSDIRSVPCAEANGSPWTVEEHGCRGSLVRHLWLNGKNHQPTELIDQVMGYFMPALYSDFRTAHKAAVVPNEEPTTQEQVKISR
ncbi:hypothetical protein LLEC1_02759 [Akanthomyces lecanii]|uniref:Nucleotide-diphospho-sugar transferase domain-containing protein n=1 Tax=Cordyceps confragosa TaxID=2714763 RepID=A0A179IRZ1_CORDF|nr:hypothetical protein LLEC1_02759 [Akanthomyces lecanii]